MSKRTVSGEDSIILIKHYQHRYPQERLKQSIILKFQAEHH